MTHPENVMGNQSKPTEHSGPKKGRGAFYGPKREAKRSSDKRRRRDDIIAVDEKARQK